MATVSGINHEICGFASHAFQEFNKIRQCGQLCDITLVCNGVQFSAHKLILAASIPYFYTMFTCGLDEMKQHKIRLDEHDADTLELIINFAYSGKISLTSKNVFMVLKLAYYMQIDCIIEQCQEYLAHIVGLVNVFSILEYGVLYGNDLLVDAANKFLKQNFHSCSLTEQFLNLNIVTICAIVKVSDLHVDSEDQVLDAAVRWINYNFDQRITNAHLIFRHVRLALVSPTSLRRIKGELLYKNSIECKNLIDNALKYHHVPHQRIIMPPMNTESRFCEDIPGVIYALGGLSYEAPSAVEFFDPMVKQWTATTTMLSVRSRFGVAVLKRELYAIGGSNDKDRYRTVEIFNANTNRWRKGRDLLHQRSAMAAVVLKGTIYVIGGYDGHDPLSSVEAIRPEWKSWIPRPCMTFKRCAPAAAVLGEHIFVMGGHNPSGIYNSVEISDFGKKQGWIVGTSLLSPRCRHGAASLNSQIYIAGGYDGYRFLNTVELFDPEKNKWFKMPDMNLHRGRMALVTNNNLLYAIGGHDGNSNIASIEFFDPRESIWHFGPSMKLHEGGVGVGVIPVTSQTVRPSISSA